MLRGGPSSEYEVSLKTGEAVLRQLPSQYEGIDVFISKEGLWHVGGMQKNPTEALGSVDVVFIALHGQYGEDGKIQRILEQIGIPFTGSGSFASSVAMNKNLTKNKLAILKGKIRMPFHKVYDKEEIETKGIHAVSREIMMPAIIKPTSGGSSIGMTVVRSYSELEEAFAKAFEHGDCVMAEEFIEGREVTCGIIEEFRDKKYYSLFPTEIILGSGACFFDYDAKYSGGSQEICPSNFDEETKLKIQEASELVHKELGLRHYSRSDFMVHPKRGIYFLEVNTLPGLTKESLFPKAVEAIGSSIPEFLNHILQLALKESSRR